MGQETKHKVDRGPTKRDPERDRSKANAFLIKDPNNDQALRQYVEARNQVIRQVLEAVGGQSETVRKIFARGLTLTGSGGGALSTNRGRKSPEAQRLGALKEAAQLQVLDWCVKRACELGGLTEQNLAKAYQEFIDAAKKVVPENLLFYENGALSVKEGLFGKDNLWEKVQNQVLAGKNTPLLKSLTLEKCLEISNKILESISTTCAGAKKEAQQPQTPTEPAPTTPDSPTTDQAFTLLETQKTGIKSLAESEDSPKLPEPKKIETQPDPKEAQLQVYEERKERKEEPFLRAVISVASAKISHDQSKDNKKPATTPPGGTPRPEDPTAPETSQPGDPTTPETPRPGNPTAPETPQPADPQPANPPNNAGPNAPLPNHQGGGGGNAATNSGGQQGGGTQQSTTPQPADPNYSTPGMSPSGSSGSNGSNINTGQPNLAFED